MCVQNISCIIQTCSRPKLGFFLQKLRGYISSNLWKCWSCQLKVVLSGLCSSAGSGCWVTPEPAAAAAELPVPCGTLFLEALALKLGVKLCFPGRELGSSGTLPMEPPLFSALWAPGVSVLVGSEKREQKMLRYFLFECCNAGLTFILLFHLVDGNWILGDRISLGALAGIPQWAWDRI